MRLVVTGRSGQVVQSLVERAAGTGDTVITLGRPHLDLEQPETIAPSIAAAAPDVIVSAAAYTAVDKAETDKASAFAVNAEGAGIVAESAAALGVPIIHLSTDYVFDGRKPTPYTEDDPTGPLGVYGASKLAGEIAVARATSNCLILRTAWLYGPFGHNFLKTMLRLAEDRDRLTIVGDQWGNPTSTLDVATAILKAARNMLDAPAQSDLRGVFHMTGSGEACWADFAETIFAASGKSGGPRALVDRITTADYPTPAPRPSNSRLSCAKLASHHGITLPDWRRSTENVVKKMLAH